MTSTLDKIKNKLRLLRELIDSVECELLSAQDLAGRVESAYTQKDLSRLLDGVHRLKGAFGAQIQPSFTRLKREVTELSAELLPSFLSTQEALLTTFRTLKANQGLSNHAFNHIRLQHELLKGAAAGRGLAKGSSGAPAESELFSEVVMFLRGQKNSAGFRTLFERPVENDAKGLSSPEKLALAEMRGLFAAGRREQKSRSPQQADCETNSQSDGHEFSVYSDFSFQAPIIESRVGKKLDTIKEDLSHIELDDLMRVSTLPISIQSDDPSEDFD